MQPAAASVIRSAAARAGRLVKVFNMIILLFGLNGVLPGGTFRPGSVGGYSGYYGQVCMKAETLPPPVWLTLAEQPWPICKPTATLWLPSWLRKAL